MAVAVPPLEVALAVELARPPPLLLELAELPARADLPCNNVRVSPALTKWVPLIARSNKRALSFCILITGLFEKTDVDAGKSRNMEEVFVRSTEVQGQDWKERLERKSKVRSVDFIVKS